MTELLDKKDQDKIKILSNEDRYKSDYIYSNRISDVDKRIYKKYNIPSNFKKLKNIKLMAQLSMKSIKK